MESSVARAVLINTNEMLSKKVRRLEERLRRRTDNLKEVQLERDAWKGAAAELRKERDLYREALEKIANQGTGSYNNDQHKLIDDNGEPWRHWAQRAREALR